MTKEEHKRIEDAMTEDIYEDMKMFMTGVFIALGMHVFKLDWGVVRLPRVDDYNLHGSGYSFRP